MFASLHFLHAPACCVCCCLFLYLACLLHLFRLAQLPHISGHYLLSWSHITWKAYLHTTASSSCSSRRSCTSPPAFSSCSAPPFFVYSSLPHSLFVGGSQCLCPCPPRLAVARSICLLLPLPLVLPLLLVPFSLAIPSHPFSFLFSILILSLRPPHTPP